ncbi:uncharacterized protein LOC106662356 [Cimex lectularius]|uniref:Uncharacterized protein n=1 Tax=Cimex lectularius TaxID=79782 RepID=A0A8I6RC76_CIMLE|nr:uncharacterized protein LOC106662356 [Cimex lectularius]
MTYIDERVIVISEIAISFALEVTRLITRMDLGYELVMNCGYSPNIDVLSFYLLITAGCTLLVGWLSDSAAGKYYVILIGLVFIVVACTAVATYFVSDMLNVFELSRYLILAYTATSGVRNAFLLEQWEIAMTIENLSKFIFYLVLVRVWVKSGISALHLVGIDIKMLFVFLSFAAAVVSFSYFIFMMGIGSRVYIESTYFLVCEKCIKCVLLAAINSCKRSKKLRRASQLLLRPVLRANNEPNSKAKRKNVSFLPKAHMRIQDFDTPHFEDYTELDKIKVSCYGYLLMTTKIKKVAGIEEKLVDLKGSSMAEDEKQEKRGLRLLRKSFVSAVQDPEPEEKIQVRRIPAVTTQRSCLDNSKPSCTDLTVRQTSLFLSAFIVTFQPFFFTIFMLTILDVTDFQARLVERPVEENLQIAYYCFYFDAFLFPLHEFVIHPILREANFRNSHFICLGYLCMFVALVMTLSINIILETHLPYLPRSNYSQIRIYNGLHTEVTVHSSWSKSRFVIFPLEFILWKDIPSVTSSDAGYHLTINESMESYKIVVMEQRTVTYIVTENGLERNSEADPSLFTGEVHSKQAKLFIVTSTNRTFDVLFFNQKTKFTFKLSSVERGVCKYVKPGVYKVSMDGVLPNTVDILPNTLYSYFVPSGNGSQGILYPVEGPLVINYYYLFIPLCLTSLANVFTSVSYYAIVIDKSPEKLRAIIFSIIVALNLTATSIYVHFIKEPRFLPVSIILTIQVFVCAVLGFLQLFFPGHFEIY